MDTLAGSLNRSIRSLLCKVMRNAFSRPRELAFLIRIFFANLRAAKVRQAYENGGLHIPPFLIASITSQCNLRCHGCYATVNEACRAPAAQLSADGWDDLFAQAQDAGISFILLAGGEPMLRRDVAECAAHYKSMIYPLSTNGLLIDPGWIRFFSANRNFVPFLSLEGDCDTTDRRRGAGVYNRLMQSMELLHKARLLYGVSVTVTNENLDMVTGDSFISLLSSLGCFIVLYVDYVPADGQSEHLTLSEADRLLLKERADAIRACRKLTVISFPGDEAAFGGCLAAGRGFFHINAAGGTEPCPFSPYSDTNLKDHRLLEALRSPLFTKLRSSGMLAREHMGGCALFGQDNAIKAMLSDINSETGSLNDE